MHNMHKSLIKKQLPATTVKSRGPGTILKFGVRQTSPGVQGNPYPKLKTPRISPTISWEGPKFKYPLVPSVAEWI